MPPGSNPTPDDRDRFVSMDGLEIFNFSVNAAPRSIEAAIEKNGLTKDDISCFVLHQANRLIVEEIAKRLGVEGDRVPININDVGNTSSVSIPLILADILYSADTAQGARILLSGFGVGLSWASTVLTKV